jgi:hypothetical protein
MFHHVKKGWSCGRGLAVLLLSLGLAVPAGAEVGAGHQGHMKVGADRPAWLDKLETAARSGWTRPTWT